MPTVCFYIKPHISVEEAWEILEASGLLLLYSSEDLQGEKEIYAQVEEINDLPCFSFISKIVPTELGSIDWQSQWEIHGQDFHDGYVHVEINESKLKLRPGPGFGNLSHPTTKLVLELMKDHVKNQDVLDIGTGSGILALAAVALGAKKVYALDIDPEAIKHAKENASINQMNDKILFDTKLKSFKSLSCVVLMNMIWSEQIEAWKSVSSLHQIPGQTLVSGILKEERDLYLQLTKSWGWQLVDEVELEGWLGFRFNRLSIQSTPLSRN
jgi:ribosomal protein L11 methyltransferase